MQKFLFYFGFFIIFFYFLPTTLLAKSEVNFKSENSQSNQNKIYLDIKQSDNNWLEVKIMGKNIFQPILGLAFDLHFDSNLLAYQKYAPGSFLEKGGTPIYLVSPDKSEANTMVVGASLKRGDELPEGSGHFLSLIFKIKKGGQSNFSFDSVSLASLNIKKQPIEGVAWLGGELMVNQPLASNWQTNIMAMATMNNVRLLFELALIGLVLFLLANHFKKFKKKG